MNAKGINIFRIWLLTFFCIQSCNTDDKNRDNYKATFNVCDSLYTETFSTFSQGAFGGDRLGVWLTDSLNFRLFLGAYDEIEGNIIVRCSNDSIIVIQKPDQLDVNKNIKDSLVHIYLRPKLKKLKNLNIQ